MTNDENTQWFKEGPNKAKAAYRSRDTIMRWHELRSVPTGRMPWSKQATPAEARMYHPDTNHDHNEYSKPDRINAGLLNDGEKYRYRQRPAQNRTLMRL